MQFLLPSRIAHAHLLDINMAGTKQYLCFVAQCTMQWRLIDQCGTLREYHLPTMDSIYGTFPTYTAYVFPATSQQRQFCTSTSSFHTEIAATYVIPGSMLCCQ